MGGAPTRRDRPVEGQGLGGRPGKLGGDSGDLCGRYRCQSRLPKPNRLRLILPPLDASQSPQDLDLPGLNLPMLKGKYKGYWAVSVSGNWRVIFRFEDNSAVDVDYIDYH